MQSADKNSEHEAGTEQNSELSAVWQALLGKQAPGSESAPRALDLDPTAQVQPQASDPWSHLLHSQGLQQVDLQKLHLRELRTTSNDDDVEHALDIMREATGQLPPLDEKA